MNPRAFRELFPELQPGLPLPSARRGRVGVSPDRAPGAADSDATHHAQHELLHRVDLRDRPLAGGAGRGGRASTCSPAFPVDGLLVDGNAVRGVRTTPSGLDRSGQPTGDYTEPTDLTARVTVVAEGTRGLLSQAYQQWQKVGSPNPQLFALGVKEVWETSEPARSRGSHPGLAAAHRCLRRKLHVSAGARPGGDRPGSRARLSRRRTGCAPAASADEAASAFSAGISRAASCSSGAPRPFPRAATTPFPSGATATAC